MTELVEFLRARYDDDERWALEASRDGDRYTPTGEHWRWECEATDTPAVVDPMLSQYVEGVDGAPVGLRSIEGYPSTWGATLYHLVIRGQDELPAAVAGHIARHDPARVLAEVDAKRRRIEHYLQVCEYADPAKHPAQEYVLAKGAVERSLMFDALPYAGHPDYHSEWAVTK